jgi:hypothetical protein
MWLCTKLTHKSKKLMQSNQELSRATFFQSPSLFHRISTCGNECLLTGITLVAAELALFNSTDIKKSWDEFVDAFIDHWFASVNLTIALMLFPWDLAYACAQLFLDSYNFLS